MKFLPQLSERQFSWLGFAVVFLLGGLLAQSGMFVTADQKVLDTGFSVSRQLFPQPVANDPVIVGINENFLDKVDVPLTLTHVYLGRFLHAMSLAEPKVVGLDIELPEKNFNTLTLVQDPTTDFHRELLGGLLELTQHSKVVAAKIWDDERSRYHNIQVDYAGVLSAQGAQGGLASVYFHPDDDGRIRLYPGTGYQPDGTNDSFSSAISAAAGVNKQWSGLINYRLGKQFTYIPIQDVLQMAQQNDTARLHKIFGGKVVLLGATLDAIDLLNLPVPMAQWLPHSTRVPGVLVHAQLLRGMLNDGLVHPVPGWLVWLLCGLFALFWLDWQPVFTRFGRASGGSSLVFKFLALSVASIVLFALFGILLLRDYWLPPMAVLFTGAVGLSANAAREGWLAYKERKTLRRIFTGYVGPAIMSELIAGDLDDNRKSRRLSVCVLFADIRDFTTLSEHLQAEEVADLLNRYFALMVAVIHRHGGTVDKFLGDGMMAFFGAPNSLISHEKSGLEAARDMLIALNELNRQLAAEGRAPLKMGVGLHSGEAVLGEVGSVDLRQYTAIGDTVNTASRIEGLCKQIGYPIVCSDIVAKAAGYPDSLIYLGEQPLKGRSPIAVYGCRPV